VIPQVEARSARTRMRQSARTSPRTAISRTPDTIRRIASRWRNRGLGAFS